jgi:hypothetical protein
MPGPVLGKDYIVRGAYAFEGPAIQWLFKDTPVADLDWDQPLDSSWVVALHPEKPEYYGTISIVASRPIGRLEMLRIAPALPRKLKALITRDLINYSLNICKQLGAQAVSGASEKDLIPTFGRTIERRWHGVPCGEFQTYLARV